MKITIELRSGRQYKAYVTKQDIQKNIDALQRYINGSSNCSDDILLIDTKTILEAIKSQLPEDHTVVEYSI